MCVNPATLLSGEGQREEIGQDGCYRVTTWHSSSRHAHKGSEDRLRHTQVPVLRHQGPYMYSNLIITSKYFVCPILANKIKYHICLSCRPNLSTQI